MLWPCHADIQVKLRYSYVIQCDEERLLDFVVSRHPIWVSFDCLLYNKSMAAMLMASGDSRSKWRSGRASLFLWSRLLGQEALQHWMKAGMVWCFVAVVPGPQRRWPLSTGLMPPCSVLIMIRVRRALGSPCDCWIFVDFSIFFKLIFIDLRSTPVTVRLYENLFADARPEDCHLHGLWLRTPRSQFSLPLLSGGRWLSWCVDSRLMQRTQPDAQSSSAICLGFMMLTYVNSVNMVFFFFQLTFLGPFLDGDPVHISQCHVLPHKGVRCETGISEMWQTHQDRSLDLFGFAEADVALQIMRPQDQSEDPIFRAARLQVCFVLVLLPCRRRNWHVQKMTFMKRHVIGIHRAGAVWAVWILRFGSEGLHQDRFSLRHSQGIKAKSALKATGERSSLVFNCTITPRTEVDWRVNLIARTNVFHSVELRNSLLRMISAVQSKSLFSLEAQVSLCFSSGLDTSCDVSRSDFGKPKKGPRETKRKAGHHLFLAWLGNSDDYDVPRQNEDAIQVKCIEFVLRLCWLIFQLFLNFHHSLLGRFSDSACICFWIF